jgi:cytochrome c oxidase subunit I+III
MTAATQAPDQNDPAVRAEQEQRLRAVWAPPSGVFLRWTDTNNNAVGAWYTLTAFGMFLFAGVLALVKRAQLAVPANDLVSASTFNQLFTLHGSMMMFLFAVPMFEAVSVLILPQLLGARDLPFPRLSAFGFWTFLVGGVFVAGSIFFDAAPDAGWFMYPPLATRTTLSGIGADIWLLGLSFIEVSSIAAAIELIVGVLKCRPPGMRLNLMPLYAWYILVVAVMILFAFPPLIAGDIMLELERAFDWPFFIHERGGDALLWQHLFWFFGHPEVYIIFLPAAGMVSMIVPTMAGTPLIGYRLIVVALIATGFFSFGLWVHHMFTTGLPALSLGFFSAASMAVSVPSGIQVFSWIATIAAGRLRLTAAALFVLGFLVVFTIGGLTGVMVAMVPFDWQAHDTYFVVAHFHYVLVGGMVFPLFAAFYYWAPAFSQRPLSERLGRIAFALIFVGFNVAFFPMHITGLIGMPRRVYTYPAGMGWDMPNMTSTVGAFMVAAGVLVFLVDLARNLRPTVSAAAGNVWNAGTLEWLENDTYAARSVPRVDSRDPLWTDPRLSEDVKEGRYYLPGTLTGRRETLVTSAILAEPQYVMRLTGPGWAHVLAAIFTAAFFLLLTVKLVTAAMICGILAVAAVVLWMWETDPPSKGKVEIGGGLRVPTYATGAVSHSWWAMVVLMLVAGALYLSYVFGYLYLWTVSPQHWPPNAPLPSPLWSTLSAVLLLLSGVALRLAGRPARFLRVSMPTLVFLGPLALVAALAVDVWGQWQAGLRPQESGYAAMVFTSAFLQAEIVASILMMSLFTCARWLTGQLDAMRRVVFDNLALLWWYAIGQGLLGLLLTHGFPRLGM